MCKISREITTEGMPWVGDFIKTDVRTVSPLKSL